MPHMAGYCSCGRRMHWPRGTRYGDTWTCYRCGTTWTWARNGENPMHAARSRPPAPPPAFTPTSLQLPAPPPFPQQPKGCLPVLLAMIGIGGSVAWYLVQLV